MSWIALAVLLIAVLPGCDGEPTYRDRPVSYWVDASRSPNVQTKQQAIGALMTFAKDARATARLAEIRTETLARREENWNALCTWLQSPAKTRERRSTIITYIGSMPDRDEGVIQYNPAAFPGKWEEMRGIVIQRVGQTSGEDQALYQALLTAR